jgi:hypothetical protein
MTTRGDVRIDIETHDEGTAAATGAMGKLNKELESISILNLDSAISVMQQFGQAMNWAFDQVREGESANNIMRAFNATVRDSAEAMENARQATVGLLDDTTLQKRVLTLNRMNMSLEEQRQVLEATTKLVVTTGESEETVFRKVIGALTDRKTALKDYGIVVRDGANALNEVSAALDNINLSDFQTRTGELTTWWDNQWSHFQQTMADGVEGIEVGFKKMGGAAAAFVLDADELTDTTETYREALSLVDDSQAGWVARLAETHEALLAVEQTKTIEFFNTVYGVNLKVADSTRQIAEAYTNVTAAVQESISAWTALVVAQQAATQAMLANVDATTKQTMAVWKAGLGKLGKRTGGRGGRRAPRAGADFAAAFDTSEALDIEPETMAEASAREARVLLPAKERTVELQRMQLELQQQITNGMGAQTVHQVDHAVAIERQIIALEQRHEIERAGLEHAQEMINAEEMRHRITMANKKAEGRLVSLDLKANKKKSDLQKKEAKSQKQVFDSSMDYWGSVGKAIGQTAAMLVDNEQDRAGIMAAMAVLDATMAGIRIISDMGVAGIPLAAATIALGAATAAGYASASGSSKPPAPGGFGAFTATAIQERPDAAGAPVVLNFNAPGAAIGWTPQQIRSELGIDGDNGGMRGAAA